jgi:hypothetical protein
VLATLTFPVGASFVSAPTGCALNSNIVICSVDTLTSGATQSFVIQLNWDSITAGTSIISNVGSDVPDSTTSNNNSNLTIVLNTTTNDADVPTLPEWGLLLMATVLMMISLRSKNRI